VLLTSTRCASFGWTNAKWYATAWSLSPCRDSGGVKLTRWDASFGHIMRDARRARKERCTRCDAHHSVCRRRCPRREVAHHQPIGYAPRHVLVRRRSRVRRDVGVPLPIVAAPAVRWGSRLQAARCLALCPDGACSGPPASPSRALMGDPAWIRRPLRQRLNGEPISSR
jgi:hypothetical protein